MHCTFVYRNGRKVYFYLYRYLYRTQPLTDQQLSHKTLSGKSSLVQRINSYLSSISQSRYLLNLDPAARELGYNCQIDIRGKAFIGIFSNSLLPCVLYQNLMLPMLSPTLPWKRERRIPKTTPNLSPIDTVDYKKVMETYKLGPNGAILTALNIFTTKFNQVLDLLEKRAKSIDYILLDTPGQIEIFTWF